MQRRPARAAVARRPPGQMLKAGRVKATRWVPTAEQMKLVLLKLLHKNPVCCLFGPDFNVLRSWGACGGVRGHRVGIKSGCTFPRCAAWRPKRWRADSSPALVPDHYLKKKETNWLTSQTRALKISSFLRNPKESQQNGWFYWWASETRRGSRLWRWGVSGVEGRIAK